MVFPVVMDRCESWMIKKAEKVKVGSVMLHSLQPHGLSPWHSPGQNTGLSLLQGIFPTQRSNPDLPQWKWILYQLSHQGTPRILEWVAYIFSMGTSQTENWAGFCTAGGFFTSWAIREVLKKADHWITDAFKLWFWRRLLRVPWTVKRSNQSILKEISPEYSLKELMLKLKLQYFDHLMRRANSWENTWCLEGLHAKGEEIDRGGHVYITSSSHWTWIRANSEI